VLPYTEKNDDCIGYGSIIKYMTIHPILTSLASGCLFLNCSKSIILTLDEVGTPPVLSTSLSQSITSDQSFIILQQFEMFCAILHFVHGICGTEFTCITSRGGSRREILSVESSVIHLHEFVILQNGCIKVACSQSVPLKLSTSQKRQQQRQNKAPTIAITHRY
jgi:hypothetical protein